jgi:hypothetical protein
MSNKQIDRLNVAAPRLWFQVGRDQREIVAGVIIDGEARWLQALVQPGSVTFSEALLNDHRNQLRRKAKIEFVRQAEAELPMFAASSGRSPMRELRLKEIPEQERPISEQSGIVAKQSAETDDAASLLEETKSADLERRKSEIIAEGGELMDQVFGAGHASTARDNNAALSRDSAHRIDVTLRTHAQSRSCYRVQYAGQTLIESAKEPLTEACRALVALGYTGRLEMWGGEPDPLMIVRDIEQAAKLAVVETVNDGPRFARYRPHPGIIDGNDGDDAD